MASLGNSLCELVCGYCYWNRYLSFSLQHEHKLLNKHYNGNVVYCSKFGVRMIFLEETVFYSTRIPINYVLLNFTYINES